MRSRNTAFLGLAASLALLLILPRPGAGYMNDLMTRYSSAYSMASGSQNILFSDGISGISYNPARLAVLDHSSFLTALSVKSGESIFLNGVFGMPLGLAVRSAFAVNLLYINEPSLNTLTPGLGFGAALGPLEAGLSASLHYNLEQAALARDFLFFKLGTSCRVAPFRFGLVFENETYENGTLFLARAQAGAGLADDRIKFSLGASQYFKKYYSPVLNFGFEATPWPFMDLTLDIENWDPSFGFIFRSYPVKLCIAAWYHRITGIFDYSLSLTFRR